MEKQVLINEKDHKRQCLNNAVLLAKACVKEAPTKPYNVLESYFAGVKVYGIVAENGERKIFSQSQDIANFVCAVLNLARKSTIWGLAIMFMEGKKNDQ